ncbi:MAG: iron chaperone [Vicinamibacterales bacterium]
MSDAPATVEEYLAGQPAAVQERLRDLRDRILAAVPGTTESIRYGMVGFELPNGRPVFLAGWKQHVSLHAVPVFDDAALEAEVAPLRSGKDTVKFPHRRPMPDEVIIRIITAMAARP